MAIQVNQDLLNTAKQSSDNYYTAQQSQLQQTRDNAINKANQAFDTGNNTEQNNINTTNQQYKDSYQQIDKQHYNDSQVADLTAYKNGLGNSMQMAGYEQGANAQFNDNNTKLMTQRDQTLNDINTRIQNLLKTKTSDVTDANNIYGVALTGVRAEADKMYNDSVFQLQQQALAQQQAQAQAQAQQSYQQALARAQATSSANGGGQAVPSANANLANQYQQYQASKLTNGAQAYYNDASKYFMNSAMKSPVMPPPAMNNNVVLSPWAKMQYLNIDAPGLLNVPADNGPSTDNVHYNTTKNWGSVGI